MSNVYLRLQIQFDFKTYSVLKSSFLAFSFRSKIPRTAAVHLVWRIIKGRLPAFAVYLWVKSWMLSMGSYLILERSCLEDGHL